jgi:AbrB family looped-hinge helix DNA binding protein
METTRLSTKGQIVLPHSIRTSRAWAPGTEFTVEETTDGILLRPAGLFPKTHLDEVAGCLRMHRRPATHAEMDRAIEREVARRRGSGRY